MKNKSDIHYHFLNGIWTTHRCDIDCDVWENGKMKYNSEGKSA